jgi:hypothetical protein
MKNEERRKKKEERRKKKEREIHAEFMRKRLGIGTSAMLMPKDGTAAKKRPRKVPQSTCTENARRKL